MLRVIEVCVPRVLLPRHKSPTKRCIARLLSQYSAHTYHAHFSQADSPGPTLPSLQVSDVELLLRSVCDALSYFEIEHEIASHITHEGPYSHLLPPPAVHYQAMKTGIQQLCACNCQTQLLADTISAVDVRPRRITWSRKARRERERRLAAQSAGEPMPEQQKQPQPVTTADPVFEAKVRGSGRLMWCLHCQISVL